MTTYASDDSILDITHSLINKLENAADHEVTFNSAEDFEGENLMFDGLLNEKRACQYVKESFKKDWHVDIAEHYENKTGGKLKKSVRFTFKRRLVSTVKEEMKAMSSFEQFLVLLIVGVLTTFVII